MRWPLKYQIMVPMTVIMLGTVVAVSAIQAYLAAEQMRERTATRIVNVSQTLAGSTYPMTRAVLVQMKGLAEADFVLVDAQGKLIASTRDDWNEADIEKGLGRDGFGENGHAFGNATGFQLAAPVTIKGQRLFHAAVAMRPRGIDQRADTLHVFYAEDIYLRERRRAALPALGIGAIAVVLVILLALLTALRVSRPMGRLRAQVQRIGDGDFQPIPLPQRDDEVRDLGCAVNHLAAKLTQYEQQIRRTEQGRLLAQLGSGLAHQLRNSATGARMALDIHRDECVAAASSESLEVATHQLVLMEKYLARFLSSNTPPPEEFQQLDFVQLVSTLFPLVQPTAHHTGVALHADLAQEPLIIDGDSVTLEHMVLNLLINAVEAAGQVPPGALGQPDDSLGTAPQVRVTLAAMGLDATGSEQCILMVEDTGAGPPPPIAKTMFDPFVTAKKDGVGLGLAIVREAVLDHHGHIRWERVGDDSGGRQRTRFIVELPMVGKGNDCANTARG